MNEWKKVSEELPPLDTTVWAGWFEDSGRFTSGLFTLVELDDDGDFTLWGLCEETISYDNFGSRMCDDEHPVSHWMYLPKPPEE
jgi:hypothetical protein